MKDILYSAAGLEILPQNKWNDILSELTDFIIERKK